MESEDECRLQTNLRKKINTSKVQEKPTFSLLITIKLMQFCGLFIHDTSKLYECKIKISMLLWSIFVRLCILCTSAMAIHIKHNQINGIQSTVLFVCSATTITVTFLAEISFILKWKDHVHLLQKEISMSSSFPNNLWELENESKKIWIAFFYVTLIFMTFSFGELDYSSWIGTVFKLFTKVIMILSWILPSMHFYQCCHVAADFIKSFDATTHRTHSKPIRRKLLTSNLRAIGLNLMKVIIILH